MLAHSRNAASNSAKSRFASADPIRERKASAAMGFSCGYALTTTAPRSGAVTLYCGKRVPGWQRTGGGWGAIDPRSPLFSPHFEPGQPPGPALLGLPLASLLLLRPREDRGHRGGPPVLVERDEGQVGRRAVASEPRH